MPDLWYSLPTRGEGIDVLEDGTILLHNLREQGFTYEPRFDTTAAPGTPQFLLDLKPRRIRITAAIPLDHTIKYGYKLPDSPSKLPTGTGIGDNVSEFVNAKDAYPRTHYIQCESYEKWLRLRSWPVPQTIIDPLTNAGTAQAPDKIGSAGNPNDALRDDLQFLQNDAKRTFEDVCRLSGASKLILKGLCFDFQPGDEVRDMSEMPINRVIREVHVLPEGQITELIFE